MGNTGNMMQTFNLLGTAELGSNRSGEARAWFSKSRRLALKLNDPRALSTAVQNIGIVCQEKEKLLARRGTRLAGGGTLNQLAARSRRAFEFGKVTETGRVRQIRTANSPRFTSSSATWSPPSAQPTRRAKSMNRSASRKHGGIRQGA
jgi:hypothetical protein